MTGEALRRLRVDAIGLDDMDRRVLTALVSLYRGGPVGLGTLAASIGEDAASIEEVCEPFILQKGLIERTPRGRAATALAHEHMDVPAPSPVG